MVLESINIEQLVTAGLTPDIAAEKVVLFKEAASILSSALGDAATGKTVRAFFVPGRVEIVGKHTDYAGGRSLLMATSKSFCVVTVDRDDDVCRFFSTAYPEPVEVTMGADLQPREGGHWTNYPVTAVRRLSRNFVDGGLKGLDMCIACDIPQASGMSTSSAMFCAVWLALNARNKFSERQVYKDNITCDEDLMEYLGCNENGQNFKDLIGDKGVGTFGGSEDHTAIMSCTKGQLNLFSYCPTHREGVFECPGDLIFVIAVSGAIAEKTGDKMQDYNDASLLAQEAARVYWDTAGEKLTPPHLCNVVKHAKGDPDSVRSSIHEYFKNGGASSFTELQLTRRFDQFFAESEEIVAQVAAAFANQDYENLSKLVDRSQLLTSTHLQNQVPETIYLADTARENGAIAASAFGAGFGGSVWALVRKGDESAFIKKISDLYSSEFPEAAEAATFFAMTPGPGAFELPL